MTSISTDSSDPRHDRRRCRLHGAPARMVVLLEQRCLADAAGVGVLGDVSLTAAVDKNAAHHQLRVAEERDLGGVHVCGVGAECLTDLDCAAVVRGIVNLTGPSSQG